MGPAEPLCLVAALAVSTARLGDGEEQWPTQDSSLED